MEAAKGNAPPWDASPLRCNSIIEIFQASTESCDALDAMSSGLLPADGEIIPKSNRLWQLKFQHEFTAETLRFLPRQRDFSASPIYQLVGAREILRENKRP